jgi:ABC-type multidrug transport system fused ATPase/permease subunit
MFGLAGCAFITGFAQKFSFGVIGENVTLNIRKRLYKSIVSKHAGWFDDRSNAPGILTTTLSSDAQVINGVSTEGLGSILEAVSALITGITIGFIFSWKTALVCIGISPFMAVSGFMMAKL